MKFRIRTKSISKNIEAIRRFEKAVEKKALEFVNELSSQVESDSKTTLTKLVSEYSTGALGRSIQAEVQKNKDGYSGNVIVNKEYSNYVEFGTGERGKATNTNTDIPVSYTLGYKGQKAKAYFYPSVKKAKKNAGKLLRKKMKEVKK